LQLPFAKWPDPDRCLWDAAFKPGSPFDDDTGRGAGLADSTRCALRVSYAQFLRFLSKYYEELLERPPAARIDRNIIAAYAKWLGRSQGEASVAISLRHLRLAYRLVCPGEDLSWLLTVAKRLEAGAERKPGRYSLVTSEQLFLLGFEIMDEAAAAARAAKGISKAHALQYRDGLIIAFLSLVPLRRRTLTALRIVRHLEKVGNLWSVDIPAEDTKIKVALDYPICRELSQRIDRYLEEFRPRLPGAMSHSGLWASNKRCPMRSDAIYSAVLKRTRKGLGFGVNPHRFRHAAATFWSIYDPENVRGAKDLLGQVSFGTTEKHYIMGQSRLAGRALAAALDGLRSNSV
jgi:integrase